MFPLETLTCFYDEELETLLCGTCESWTVEMLADIIKFDHGWACNLQCDRPAGTLTSCICLPSSAYRWGYHQIGSDDLDIRHGAFGGVFRCWTNICGLSRYTNGSTAVQHFLETLTELDSADQRRFLRFVTGSPSLPPGGVAALQPR